MDIGNYLRRKMAMLSLAMARVEKSSLNQTSDAMGSEGTAHETMESGSMASNMLKGVVTMEVKEMRWRMYKMLNAAEKYKTKVVGYKADGMPITETTIAEKINLRSVLKDDEDPYELELLVTNDEDVKSTTEALSNELVTIHKDGDKVEDRVDRFGLVGAEEHTGLNLGEISFDDMVSTMRNEKSIFIHREIRPKFEIEHYTKQLLIRNISDEEKLLEFYVSIYPDEYDRKSNFFIKEVQKAMENPRVCDILDVLKVGFVTNKTLGAENGMEYIYEIKNFHKVVKFNGYYVIKFIATPLINGNFIFEKHKMDDLEQRYENKEAKKRIK